MSHKKARAAYEGRLATWAAARSPALLVAYQNKPFTPTADTAYLQAFILPALTDSQDVEGAHRVYQGVFQVSIVAPLNKGPGAADGIADELAALFVHNARLLVSGLYIQQITPLSVAPALQNAESYTLPCSFTYRADTT